jgi:hypothetical protein
VLGHLAAGDRSDHGADIGQRAEHRELQRAVKDPQTRRNAEHKTELQAYAELQNYLRDGELEVCNHGVLGGGGEPAGEAELDGAERDDERAEEGGDVGLAQDGHGGGSRGDAELPRAHPVPAPRVHRQQRLPQASVDVAAAVVAPAAGRPPVAPVVIHGAAVALSITTFAARTLANPRQGRRRGRAEDTTRRPDGVALKLGEEEECGERLSCLLGSGTHELEGTLMCCSRLSGNSASASRPAPCFSWSID